MSQSLNTVGKQGATKVRKQPFESLNPGTKPRLVPLPASKPQPVELSQDEIFTTALQRLLKMSVQEKKEFHKRLGDETQRILENRFGQNYTKESVTRVFTDERKQILSMVTKANAKLQQELMDNSTVPEKEMYMGKAMQVKKLIMKKLRTKPIIPSPDDLLDLLPMLNEMGTHLFEAYGVMDKLKQDYAPAPSNKVDEYIDNFLDNLPPTVEVVIDDDIDYLEELDRMYPRDSTPEYLGRQENSGAIRVEQQCENYLICKSYPLLLDSETDPEKLYPMQTLDIKDTIYVTAKQYNQRQILNRVAAKLRNIKPKRFSLRVSALRTAGRMSFAIFVELKKEMEKLSEDERFSILSTSYSFDAWLAKLVPVAVDEKDLIRLDLIDTFPRTIGIQQPESSTAVPQSKNGGVRLFNCLRIWNCYESLKSLFKASGQDVVSTTLADKMQIPSTMPKSSTSLMSIFSVLVIAVSFLAITFAVLFGGGPVMENWQPKTYEAPQVTPLENYANYENLPREVLKRIVPEFSNLNTTLTQTKRDAFCAISEIFNISTEFSTTIEPARISVEQMSTEEVREFVRDDIKRGIFHVAFGKNESRDKFEDAVQLLGPRLNDDTAELISNVKNLYSYYKASKAPLGESIEKQVFIQSVEELVDNLMDEKYKDVEGLRKNILKYETQIYRAKVLASPNPDNTIAVLKTYDQTFSNVANTVRQTLDNMMDIATLDESIEKVKMEPPSLQRTQTLIYYEHMKLIREKNPEYIDETAINLYAPTVLSSSSLQIFDSIVDSSSKSHVRAYFNYFSKLDPDKPDVAAAQVKIDAIAKDMDSVHWADPENVRATFIYTWMLSINGIARQIGLELTPTQSIQAILGLLFGTSTVGAACFQYKAFFGQNFGNMSRWVKTAQRTWFCFVLFTICAMGTFYYRYESWLGVIGTNVASPLGGGIAPILTGVELLASFMNKRLHNLLFPLLGGFDPEVASNQAWYDWLAESLDIFGGLTGEYTKAGNDYFGLLFSPLGATLAAYAVPIVGAISATATAGFAIRRTYAKYDQTQMDIKVKTIMAIWNILVFDVPSVSVLLDRMFQDESTSRNTRGNVVFSGDALKNEMQNINNLGLLTMALAGAGAYFMSPQNVLSVQSKELYGVLRSNVGSSGNPTLSGQIAYLGMDLSTLSTHVPFSVAEYGNRYSLQADFLQDIYNTKTYFVELLDKIENSRDTFNERNKEWETLKGKPRALRQVVTRETLSLQPVNINGTWTVVEETPYGYYLDGSRIDIGDAEKLSKFTFDKNTTYTQIGLEEISPSGERVICVRTPTLEWVWVPSSYFLDVNHSIATTDALVARATLTKDLTYKSQKFKKGITYYVQPASESGQTVWRAITKSGGYGIEIPLDAVDFSPVKSFAPEESGKKFMLRDTGPKVYTAGVVLPTDDAPIYQLLENSQPPAVFYRSSKDLIEVPKGPFKIKTKAYLYSVAQDGHVTKDYFYLYPSDGLGSFTKPFGQLPPGSTIEISKITDEGFHMVWPLEKTSPTATEFILQVTAFDMFEIMKDEPVPQPQPLVSSRCATKKGRPQRK